MTRQPRGGPDRQPARPRFDWPSTRPVRISSSTADGTPRRRSSAIAPPAQRTATAAGEHAAEHRRRRCGLISPAPVPKTMGTRPARITATVIASVASRYGAPSSDCVVDECGCDSGSLRARGVRERVLQVDQHHDAELRGEAGKRNEAGRWLRPTARSPSVEEPDPADQREGQRRHDQQRPVGALEGRYRSTKMMSSVAGRRV